MIVAPQINLTNAEKVFGWMSSAELRFLAETSQTCKEILEIGSFQGRSTRAMADNSPKDCIIIACDPWDFYISPTVKSDAQTYSLFHGNLRDHIKNDKVIPVHRTYDEYNPHTQFDFIFIDGDHYAQSVKHDIEKALTMIKPGGIIAGHDYCDVWPEVKLVVDNIFPQVNLVETIWWQKI